MVAAKEGKVPALPSLRATKKWIRNASDELALAKGCRFDERRGAEVVEWIQEYCHLYEGERAGELITLDDWQYDCTLRVFGWVRQSVDWGRIVRRFRRAGIWVPKKNAKSPTLASWGIFLLIGDGEFGQKVFSCALDRNQAKISHEHAIQMVRMSPALDEECEINGTTGRIIHKPTQSFYDILSSSGLKNIRAKEGINGCTLKDEVHVIDERFAKVTRFAGASRAQALDAEFSTSGNNPDGYGRKRYDFGKRVESGDLPVDDFFFACYEAPQDTTPEDLADRKNLIRLGKLANPSWGRIIRESEFVAAYEESSATRSDTFEFLMYRLNVWQQSSNPWLSIDKWKACGKAFTLDDLKGCECKSGLDLASTQDLNSLSLCFRLAPKRFRFLWWFWLPEEAAERHAKSNEPIPYFEWAKDPRCHLTLTPGSAVHHESIVKTFRDLNGLFRITGLNYDEHGPAEQTTRNISEGQSIDGRIIEVGTGVERQAFSQSMTSFNAPTKEFERMVLEGELEHNCDPLMTWQAGHVAVKRDHNDNIKPVKPGGDGDPRKIDGFIAGIQALAGWMEPLEAVCGEPVCYTDAPPASAAQGQSSPPTAPDGPRPLEFKTPPPPSERRRSRCVWGDDWSDEDE
jgi:phage terminase large subunit-like protein